MQLSDVPQAQGLIPPTMLGTANPSKGQLRFGSAQQLCPGMWALQQTIMIIASDNNRQKMFVSWQHRKQTPSRAHVHQPSLPAQPMLVLVDAPDFSNSWARLCSTTHPPAQEPNQHGLCDPRAVLTWKWQLRLHVGQFCSDRDPCSAQPHRSTPIRANPLCPSQMGMH